MVTLYCIMATLLVSFNFGDNIYCRTQHTHIFRSSHLWQNCDLVSLHLCLTHNSLFTYRLQPTCTCNLYPSILTCTYSNMTNIYLVFPPISNLYLHLSLQYSTYLQPYLNLSYLHLSLILYLHRCISILYLRLYISPFYT